MRTTKYLLIGGGLTASRAADQIRKRDSDGSITIVTDEPYAPYDRPPLSKELLRKERKPEELLYHPVESLASQNIDLLTGASVHALDLDRRIAHVEPGPDLPFEKALLATGGRPVHLGVPGEELAGVHYLRTLDDANAIIADAEGAERAVIIGAGFIGLEAAASLTELGLRVTVIEMASRVWPRFADPVVADFFQSYCSDRGITFQTGEVASRITGDDRVASVVTSSSGEYDCDLVLVSVGIQPNIELAERAGLRVDDGIVVDSHMRTSNEHVFAAGDVIDYNDPVFDRRRRVEHWGHAEHSGQIAGMNMAGDATEYDMLSYVWSDVFDLHLEFAGDEAEHDRTLLRGNLENGSFTQLYFVKDRLTAYFSVNGPRKEFLPLQKLIRRRLDLRGRDAELANPEQSLRDLL